MREHARRHRHPTSLIGLFATLCTLTACQSYEARPLSRLAVDEALATPALVDLAESYTARPHPLLPPVQINPADGIDPTEAACLAVVINPDLRAERARRGVAAAQVIQAGLLPNPQLGASFDVPSGGATADTMSALGLGVSWDLDALITHDADLAAARAEDRAAALDLLWQEWQVASAARLAVTQAAWQEQVCATLALAVTDAQTTLDDLTRALDAGEATSLDVAATRSTLHGYIAQLRAAERSRDLAQLEAKRAIGLPPDADLSPTPPAQSAAYALPSLDDAFATARDTRVDLAALREGYEAQEQRTRSAVLSQFPKLNIGLSAARDTGDVQTLGLGVSIDLPIFDRAQGRIAEERATREALFAEYVAREFSLRSDLGAILAELERLAPEIQTQQASLEAAQDTLRIIEDDRNRQLVDILSVEQLRDEVINNRLALLELGQRQAELRVALEAAIGAFGEGGGS